MGDIRRSAARMLVRIPEARGEGWAPGEPDREPYAWDEIDAYEILFCQVVHGGGHGEPREYLRLIGSFANYLGEVGVIPTAEHAALQAEWALWSKRLVEVWDRDGWYLADGTHLTREELERRDRACRPERSGSRFGKFRPRRRPSRRR